MLLDVVLVALGTFFFTAAVKYAITVKLLPLMTMLMVASFSLIIASYLHWGSDPRSILSIWIGAAGLSLLLHAAHKLLHGAGDAQRVSMLRGRSVGR